jgi:hypothetical protein
MTNSETPSFILAVSVTLDISLHRLGTIEEEDNLCTAFQDTVHGALRTIGGSQHNSRNSSRITVLLHAVRTTLKLCCPYSLRKASGLPLVRAVRGEFGWVTEPLSYCSFVRQVSSVIPSISKF